MLRPKLRIALAAAMTVLAADECAAFPHSGVAAIYSGQDAESTCAVLADRRVQCWGYLNGGLMATPTYIGEVRSMSVSLNTVCAVLKDQKAVCLGRNIFGQIGDGTRTDRPTPTYVLYLGLPMGDILAIALGDEHTCALKSDGLVYCWGYNIRGQLGNYMAPDPALNAVPVVEPSGSSFIALNNVEKISAGSFFTCAQLNDGSSRCWGLNTSGQLGTGTVYTQSNWPVDVRNTFAMTPNGISVGNFFGCSRASVFGNDSVSCWGSNFSGELGNGTFVDNPVPSLVTNDDSSLLTHVNELVAGGSLACVIAEADSTVKCWGHGKAYAEAIKFENGTTLNGVTQLAAGASHACTLDSKHVVTCWGDNSDGQLGGDYPDGLPHTPDTTALDPPIFTDDLEIDTP